MQQMLVRQAPAAQRRRGCTPCRRVVFPVIAGIGGMFVPVGIYLAVNASSPSASGWGVAMSTDTAFALGLLALVGVVCRIGCALSCSPWSGGRRDGLGDNRDCVAIRPLLFARRVLRGGAAGSCGQRALRAGVRAAGGGDLGGAVRFRGRPRRGGPGDGLTHYAYAYAPARGDLEQATGLFRLFREQPTPELARSALRSARPSRAEKKPHTKTTRVTSATAAASRFASLPTG